MVLETIAKMVHVMKLMLLEYGTEADRMELKNTISRLRRLMMICFKPGGYSKSDFKFTFRIRYYSGA